ncbi:EF-hand domain-containing protein [Novosphingobium sp.]|uniref:EF-hand domain-containing protein n=1 Tax=Novosphingobium sp. TaxID=1874826 RepID=UPI003B5223B4
MTELTQLWARRAACVLALAPVAACGQPAHQGSADPSARQPAAVTLALFVQRHEKRLLAYDTDHDGTISRSEFMAGSQGHKGDPSRRFARLDMNGDGRIDKSEIDAMLTRRFRRLDTNGDGMLSADERAAAHGRDNKADGDKPD